MAKIFPSLIASDILNLETQIKKLENICDGFHIDIMDGHFVPNLTWGAIFVNAISHLTKKPLFVHLMVDHPEIWPSRLEVPPESILCFHSEATSSPEIITQQIKEKNIAAAVAIKPSTDIKDLYSTLEYIDHVLLMSVEPGSSGKPFLTETVIRLNELINYKKENSLNFSISMDGGIDKTNIKRLSELGVEIFAVGSAIFNSTNPTTNIKELYNQL